MSRELPLAVPAPPLLKPGLASNDQRPMSRRETLAVLTGLPAVAWLERAEHVWRRVAAEQATGAPFEPRFFTAHEWRTVRLLVDILIPRDGRSGSATDAGVPEFMDFMMRDQPALALPTRGGLHWLDTHCRDRFGAPFADCAPEQRTAALDEIAWPARAHADVSQGVGFFTGFRDLTASGFWTSRMGIADLQYMGNTVVRDWTGCPPAALEKLGVSYD